MPRDESKSTITLGNKTIWLSTNQGEGGQAGHEEFEELQANPGSIPDDWKGVIIFEAAPTRDGSGDHCVLALSWDGTRWDHRFFYLGDEDWLPSDRFVHVSPAP